MTDGSTRSTTDDGDTPTREQAVSAPQALTSHRADRADRARRLALVAAPLVTLAVVGTGLALTEGTAGPVDRTTSVAAPAPAPGSRLTEAELAERGPGVSRSSTSRIGVKEVRLLTEEKPRPVVAKRWTTAPLALRLLASGKAAEVGIVAKDRKVAITGRRLNGFAEVISGGESRWVTSRYVVKDRPKPPPPPPAPAPPTAPTGTTAPAAPAAPTAPVGLGTTSCAGTSATENGLTSNAVRVYRAVCNAFPQITTYGGLSNHGEHTSGRAIDIMTPDSGLGTAIADFLRAHAGELNLYDVIWSQRIWTPERSGEGWRGMSDRGSSTANHFDHVHVSVR